MTKQGKPNVAAFGNVRLIGNIFSIFFCSDSFDRECPENNDMRRRVCSNFNQTWQSDCHLLKHRCTCLEGTRIILEFNNLYSNLTQIFTGVLKDCTDDHKHMHINYYGECKEIEECQKDILEDFPRRMREWLDHIIR